MREAGHNPGTQHERNDPAPRVKGRKSPMTYQTADNFIQKAAMYGASRIGLDASYRVMDPLAWYISTGRASYEFTARLATKKPYRIFQVLHKAGGSYDDAIKAVKLYLGID